MKTVWTWLPCVLIFVVGCGKKERTGEWVGSDPKVEYVQSTKPKPPPATRISVGAPPEVIQKSVPPEVKLPKLETLQVGLPGGWTKEFLSNTNQWYIDKREPKFLTRVVVTRSPVEIEPKTLPEYIKFLHDKADEDGFVWVNQVSSGNLPDGFYIVSRIRLAVDVTNTNPTDVGVCVVRTIGGDRIKFKAHKIKQGDGTQEEALEIGKGARF